MDSSGAGFDGGYEGNSVAEAPGWANNGKEAQG